MHIHIEDKHTFNALLLQQHIGGDRQIVEDAEAGGVIVMGMMGTTGQVTGNAMLKGQLRRQNRA